MSLEKVSLIISFVGIILLLFLSQNLEPKLVKISEINDKMTDSYVKIKGNLTEIRSLEGMQILNINDGTESISAVIYTKANLTKGAELEIQGKVVRYRSSLEIEAQKIKEI
ncbi:hypothetical protein HZA33_03075 [Candidatus Pacearchaeota archaeon]|nr:hypothetical protein [Candidatus Pacearchaeota archaeon]